MVAIFFFFVEGIIERVSNESERPWRNNIGAASERFDVLVGHWLCRVVRVEVKVRFLRSRRCEVHVHAATRFAGSYEPSTTVLFLLYPTILPRNNLAPTTFQ